MKPNVWIFTLFFALTVAPLHALSASERAHRLDRVAQALAPTLDALERKATQPGAQITTRDLTNGALGEMELGRSSVEASRLLTLALAAQNADPTSPDYGAIPWELNRPEVQDENAVEFAAQPLGPLLLRCGSQLPREARKALEAHAPAFIAALRRREMKTPAYTNIYLMRAVDLLLIGQAAHDDSAVRDGAVFLKAWQDYTRLFGIHEYDSPTYYAADLDSLGLAARFVTDPDTRSCVRSCLARFWADIAANFFAGQGTLAGAHSRDYDFLRGGGGLDLSLYLEGLRSQETFQALDLEKVDLLETEALAAYHPSETILAVAALPERIVRQRWDSKPEKDRYTYLAPGFALGSADGDYGPQDKPISLQFASPISLPNIAVVPDVFDAPYGLQRRNDKSGHSKPVHLPLHPVTVQDKGALLALLNLNPKDAGDTESLATNILLPAQADAITLNGRPVDLTHPTDIPASPDAVIGLRVGGSGAAIRLFDLDGSSGQAPDVHLKADAIGLKHGAARLVVYHYQGTVRRLDSSPCRVGLVILAVPCADDRQLAALTDSLRRAPLHSQVASDRWDVEVHLPGTRLQAAADLRRRVPLSRRVNGQDVVSPVFAVNGREIPLR